MSQDGTVRGVSPVGSGAALSSSALVSMTCVIVSLQRLSNLSHVVGELSAVIPCEAGNPP
jgi:hypothetical protein